MIILQNFAKEKNIQIENVGYRVEILTEAEADLRNNEGVTIKGMYIQSARWDEERKVIAETRTLEMQEAMPPILFVPVEQVSDKNATNFVCPIYSTTRKDKGFFH